MARTDSQLVAAFKHAMQLRREMRESGSTPAECDRALEKILRANWPVPPVEEWPEKYLRPVCMACDGTGLMIRTVVNRLGITVDEGTPCRCWAGEKFKPKPRTEADFTQAGKTPQKPKGFTRWSER